MVRDIRQCLAVCPEPSRPGLWIGDVEPNRDRLGRSPEQAGAYQNGAWVVGVAKCGIEEGCMLIGQSCIIAPTGEIVAMCTTLEDEITVARCDLDRCREIRENIFNFALHRQPHAYAPITALTSPPDLR